MTGDEAADTAAAYAWLIERARASKDWERAMQLIEWAADDGVGEAVVELMMQDIKQWFERLRLEGGDDQ